MSTKVVHLTSAHPRFDTRIFVKMCSSLASMGFTTSLIVADGLGNCRKNNVSIVDVGAKQGGRISRMTKTVYKVYKAAVSEDADIYHLHDPELLLIALLLKRKGKKVIFDAHEDLPVQILSKPYLSPKLVKITSSVALYAEHFFCKRIDAVVTATPFIRDKFLKINSNSVDVNNYPKVDEFININTSNYLDRNTCCYIGGITKVRGIYEIVNAIEVCNTGAGLELAGTFSEANVERGVTRLKGWSKVKELGWIDRSGIVQVLARSFAGLVTLHPIQNYQDALPVKMFEYMAAGVPVIASNIALWKSIINEAKCGICVDPYSKYDIANAIDFLAENLDEAKEMGERGRAAVLEKYNWDIEENKLIDLYTRLLS